MKEVTFIESEDEFVKALGFKDRQEIWDRHISLDDWDYALIIKGKVDMDKTQLERLLTGCCDNEWTYLEDKDLTVGVAYHA